MNYRKLISLVKAEAKMLKEHATPKQINKLKFKDLLPDHTEMCIYGQMTGYCFSLAASNLINKCCKQTYNNGKKTFINCTLNGKPHKRTNRESSDFWSPIEVFIAIKNNDMNGNNAALVAYIKGETKTLKFG